MISMHILFSILLFRTKSILDENIAGRLSQYLFKHSVPAFESSLLFAIQNMRVYEQVELVEWRFSQQHQTSFILWNMK